MSFSYDSEFVDLTYLQPIYEGDVCGNDSGQFCRNAPQNQIVSIGLRPDGSELFVATLLGAIYKYNIGPSDSFGARELFASVIVDVQKFKEFGLTGIVVTEEFVFTAVTTVDVLPDSTVNGPGFYPKNRQQWQPCRHKRMD